MPDAHALLSFVRALYAAVPWGYVDGGLITANTVYALAARNDAAGRLALWNMASFMAAMFIELGAHLPLLGVWLAGADAILLIRYRKIWHECPDVRWIKWPLSTLQLMSITAHFLNLATHGEFKHLYLAVLDLLFILTLLVNWRVSRQDGVHLGSILPFNRPHIDQRPDLRG